MIDQTQLCDHDCNHCPIVNHPNSRLLTRVLNELHTKFKGYEVYKIVEKNCPNMTCCYDCRIDDFCHVEGCEIVKDLYEEKQPEPQEETKPVDYYLQEAKGCFSAMNYLNSSYAQAASTGALIFIGEQLAEQNKLLARIARAMEIHMGVDKATTKFDQSGNLATVELFNHD